MHTHMKASEFRIKAMNTGSTGPNRIFDELAKLMTDAAGVAQGVKGEAETAFKSQAERVLNGLDLIKRDEFDSVREMAINAREENDRLSAQIEALETRLAKIEGGKFVAKKPVAKKTTAKASTKKSAPKA